MKRYHFALEAVLRVRRAQEEAAGFALAHANQQRQRAVDAHRAALARCDALVLDRGRQDHESFRRERDVTERRAAAVTAAQAAVDAATDRGRRPATPTGRPRPSWWPPSSGSTNAVARNGAWRSSGPRWPPSTNRPSPDGWPTSPPRPARLRGRGAGVTSVDASVMVARMQAVGAELSSLGPALEQAAPSGEFASVLANANAVLAAAADPAVRSGGHGRPATLVLERRRSPRRPAFSGWLSRLAPRAPGLRRRRDRCVGGGRRRAVPRCPLPVGRYQPHHRLRLFRPRPARLRRPGDLASPHQPGAGHGGNPGGLAWPMPSPATSSSSSPAPAVPATSGSTSATGR